MLPAFTTYAVIGLTGLALGLLIAWYLLRQRYTRDLQNSQVRWSRRIKDEQDMREEHQARLDRTLRHSQEREQTLEQALRESDETVALLSDEKLPAYEQDLANRNLRIKELEQATAHQRADIADAKDLAETMSDQLERFANKLKQRDARIEELSGDYSELQEQLQTRETELSKQFAELEAQSTARENALLAIQTEYESLSLRIPELESQVAAGKEHVAVITTLQRRISDMEALARDSALQVSSLKTELADSRDRLPALEQTVAMRDQRVAELLDSLNDERQNITRLGDLSDVSQARVRELELELEQSSRRAQELEEASRDETLQRQQIKQERDQLESQLPELKKSLHDYAVTIEDLRGRVGGYESRLGEYDNQLRQRDAQIAKLEKDFSVMHEKLPALNDALREREASIEDLIAELAKERKRIRLLKQQNYVDIEVDRSNTNVIHLNRRFPKSDVAASHSTPVMPSDSGRRLRSAEAEAQRWKRQYEARKAAGADAGSDYRPAWCLENPLGEKDDLRKIRGIGPVMEQTLNELGIFHFDQLAGLHKPDIKWVAKHINTFPGRINRDRWIEQARELAGHRLPDSKAPHTG